MQPSSNERYARLLDTLGIRSRRIGNEVWAACPHPDHPNDREFSSWSLNVHSGVHYCFGCQFGGNAQKLVEVCYDITPQGAWSWLERNGFGDTVWVPTQIEVQLQTWSPKFSPPPFRTGDVTTWPKPVRDYVVQNRQLTPGQVAAWRVGYSIDGRLAGRIVIPVHDEYGAVVNYHARAFGGREPKYLYPSEAEHAEKDAMLGVQFWAPPQLRSKTSVVVTEGGFDALACERSGARYVAAIGGSGSTLTANQAARLATWGRVVIATDNDHAGNRVYSMLKSMLARYTEVTRVELPEGFDCNKLPPEHLGRLLHSAMR